MQKHICKNCKYYFKFVDKPYKPQKYGDCNCEKFEYEEYGNYKNIKDKLVYSDYEGYSAYFYVGEEFGCIHWKQKDENTILDRMFELLKDGETHTYTEIAEKVWECELDENLMRNIRTQKSRLRKKYNLNFKTLHNRGIRLISDRNGVDE